MIIVLLFIILYFTRIIVSEKSCINVEEYITIKIKRFSGYSLHLFLESDYVLWSALIASKKILLW